MFEREKEWEREDHLQVPSSWFSRTSTTKTFARNSIRHIHTDPPIILCLLIHFFAGRSHCSFFLSFFERVCCLKSTNLFLFQIQTAKNFLTCWQKENYSSRPPTWVRLCTYTQVKEKEREKKVRADGTGGRAVFLWEGIYIHSFVERCEKQFRLFPVTPVRIERKRRTSFEFALTPVWRSLWLPCVCVCECVCVFGLLFWWRTKGRESPFHDVPESLRFCDRTGRCVLPERPRPRWIAFLPTANINAVPHLLLPPQHLFIFLLFALLLASLAPCTPVVLIGCNPLMCRPSYLFKRPINIPVSAHYPDGWWHPIRGQSDAPSMATNMRWSLGLESWQFFFSWCGIDLNLKNSRDELKIIVCGFLCLCVRRVWRVSFVFRFFNFLWLKTSVGSATAVIIFL